VIAVAVRPRAAALTGAVLAAAAVRGLLQPLGDLPAAVGFVVVMVGILGIFGGHPLPALPLRGRGLHPPLPLPKGRGEEEEQRTLPLPKGRGEEEEQRPLPLPALPLRGRERHPPLPLPRGRGEEEGRGVLAGIVVGFVLLRPVIGAGGSGRSLDGFWGWGAAIVVVATLEEIVIRGRLQPAWSAEAGPVAGLLASAIVFALIHLPRYGMGAMPLDFSVGLALAGLRAVTGRVAPCAIAHVIADWGAWFWL